MAPHSSVLAWRIPGTGEPGGLPSVGSNRVGHDWSDLAAAVSHLINSLGFPGSSDSKESTCNAEDPGSVPGSGRSPPEEEMATHSSTFARKIPWTEEPGSPWGRKELDKTECLRVNSSSCVRMSIQSNSHWEFMLDKLREQCYFVTLQTSTYLDCKTVFICVYM